MSAPETGPPSAGSQPPQTPQSAPSSTLRFASPGSHQRTHRKIRTSLDSSVPSAYSLSPLGQNGESLLRSARRSVRSIARSPYKVLDAPGLRDDFYLSLLDWSTTNVLAVGLGTAVYMWSALSGSVTLLCDLGPRDSVACVRWSKTGTYLAVGTAQGEVQLWDAARCSLVRSFKEHTARVGSMAWGGSDRLASGSRDTSIHLHDIRAREDVQARHQAHTQEVCGLAFSHDGARYLASGGNDNNLFVWGSNPQTPLLRFTAHTAAIKALSWSPHSHALLASGGGSADRTIRIWNTTDGAMVKFLDTGSQVTNLIWSRNTDEILSTHGYSQNAVMLWSYPSLSQMALLTGHSLRVLYAALSPDGQSVATGAGDETVLFWNMFPLARKRTSRGAGRPLSLGDDFGPGLR